MLVKFIMTQGAAVLALLASISAAPAAECPRKDALGTSRVLAVDPAIYPRVGSKSFPQTLPLEDHEMALHGVSTTVPSTPFFRAPYFEMTPQTLDNLQKRGFVVFGADLWASDWNKMTPQQELKLLTERLNAAKKGIILLHDPKAQTAAMLQAFLRYLRDNHYRVVHVVPAAAATSAASTPNPQ